MTDEPPSLLALLFVAFAAFAVEADTRSSSASRTTPPRGRARPRPRRSLFARLGSHTGGGQASVRPRERLPRFPMVLHRGGSPEGS